MLGLLLLIIIFIFINVKIIQKTDSIIPFIFIAMSIFSCILLIAFVGGVIEPELSNAYNYNEQIALYKIRQYDLLKEECSEEELEDNEKQIQQLITKYNAEITKYNKKIDKDNSKNILMRKHPFGSKKVKLYNNDTAGRQIANSTTRHFYFDYE